MKIKFLDLQQNYFNIKKEIDNNIVSVLTKCNYILGEEVCLFENNYAKYIGTKHCIGVANGTDALEIAVQSLELPHNSEIIVQGNTYIASCLAVVNNKHKLVIADCDINTHMIDINDIKNKITPNTKVLIIVHLFGLVPNMDKIIELCNSHNIILIEDCAQAHGAMWKDRIVGTFGKLSCFSFYPGKNLGAYGDGGAICTDDDLLNEKIRRLSNLGCKTKYHHDLIGRNSRLDTIQATILNTKLKYLDDNNKKRIEHANKYIKLLSDISDISLPHIEENSLPVFHLFVIKSKFRDELKSFLIENGIECGIHYPISITETNAFSCLNLNIATNCIRNSKEILSLPIYPELLDEHIKYISDKIHLFYKRKEVYTFQTIITENKIGTLHYINDYEFNVKRIFFINNFNDLSLNTNKRGFHANLNFNEFFIVLEGSVELKLINKFNTTTIKKLNKNNAFYIPSNNWIEFEILDRNTIIFVLCDRDFESSECINTFDKFLSD
jgi:dTDP-4-amino-4,6-dideoxygalactose transaminase